MAQSNVERNFNMPSLLRVRQARHSNADRVDGIWTSLSNDEFFALKGHVLAYTGVQLAGYGRPDDAGSFSACQRTVDALEDLLDRMNRCASLRAIAARVAAGEFRDVERSDVEQAWSAAFADAPTDESLQRLVRSLKRPFDAWTKRDGDDALNALVYYAIAPRGLDTELAFSGGGTRSAAFSLGVLLYVIDAGQFSRVRQISSVSGGSITNGFVANSISASGGASPSETLSDFARRLSGSGLPLERTGKLVARLLLVGATVIVVAGMLLIADAAFDLKPLLRLMLRDEVVRNTQFARDKVGLLLAGFLIAMGAYLGFAALWAFRFTTGTIVEAWFAHTINATKVTYPRIGVTHLVVPNKLSRVLFDAPDLTRRRLSHLKSPITHVFSATDLRHGEHFHFSQHWTASNTFGITDAGDDIFLDEAVRASAAFPGALPPVRLKLNRLRLPPDKTVGQHHLELVDGGVRDNLGHVFQTRLLPDRSDERQVLTGYREGGLCIVVDASAPRGVTDMSENFLARIPILRKIEQVVTFPRVIGIMNQSNSEARALALARHFSLDGDGIVVQVRDSPVDACRRAIGEASIVVELMAGRGVSAMSASGRERRAVDALRALVRVDPATEAKWNGQRNLNQAIATTLDGLGERQVAGLLRHGYVLAMCMAYIEFDWPLLPDDQWSDDRFERMTRVSDPA